MQAFHSATLRRRIAAYFIDLFVIMGIVMVTLFVAVMAYGSWKYAGDPAMMKDMVSSRRTESFAQLAHAIFFFSYFTLAHWYFGQTIGKWLMGIEVTHHRHGLSFSRSLLRSFGYLVSGSFTLGLGYLPALFRKDERTLHDMIAGTDVVLKRKQAEVVTTRQDKAA
jgi:uncharacterized RDD family membrane protein YckC